MSKLDTNSYKGVRDFYPEDQFAQNYIFDVWRKTAESFGCEEYGASILEPTELYTEKSGEEIVNEQTFTFEDRGGRSVTLRPELTPTLARMIAGKKRELALPVRWYSIPNVFRYEAPQRGRLREHWQLNVDLIGSKGIGADLELVMLADKIMREFGSKPEDYEIRLNTLNGNTAELEQFVKTLAELGVSNTRIDTELARGQAYYTGIVFEFFDTNPANPRSILGGGRYDDLTELFGVGGVPFLGFGAGDVTIRDFLETHGLMPKYKPGTDVYIALMSFEYKDSALELAEALRSNGFNTAIDWSERKVGDMLKTADRHSVPYSIVVGEEEAKNHTYKLKNMETGEELDGSADSLILELNKVEDNA